MRGNLHSYPNPAFQGNDEGFLLIKGNTDVGPAEAARRGSRSTALRQVSRLS
jgi:hypothetical protein